MTDTVYILLNDTIVNTDLELLTQVRDFYDSSWQKLIIYGSLLIFIIGALVPLLINYFQRQSFKDEITRIIQFYEKGIDEKIDRKIFKTREEVSKEISDSLNNATEELEKLYNRLDYRIRENYYLSILNIHGPELRKYIKNGRYADAAFPALLVLKESVNFVTNREKSRIENTKSIFKNFTEEVLPNSTFTSIEVLFKNLDQSPAIYINYLRESDTDSIFGFVASIEVKPLIS